ncbi:MULTISPECIES: hypothetical protein [Pseudomonas]|uniref:hypothetical protein n=1 Tax=Pseudomonas TaxID=286 RepID=UPI000A965655|nr:hypothetical protein [Pseudomonas sp. NBRC 111136]
MHDREVNKFLLEFGKAWQSRDRRKQQTAAVKPFAKFDELVYQTMVVTKMIKLIQKYKEQKQ